jgi:hypothetical protein
VPGIPYCAVASLPPVHAMGDAICGTVCDPHSVDLRPSDLQQKQSDSTARNASPMNGALTSQRYDFGIVGEL